MISHQCRLCVLSADCSVYTCVFSDVRLTSFVGFCRMWPVTGLRFCEDGPSGEGLPSFPLAPISSRISFISFPIPLYSLSFSPLPFLSSISRSLPLSLSSHREARPQIQLLCLWSAVRDGTRSARNNISATYDPRKRV